MSLRHVIAAGFAALIPGVLQAEPALYDLDPDHSFAHFEVLHFGTSTIRGRIGPLAGGVQLDRAARRGEVGLRIDMRTLSSGVPVFDARLKRDDLFAVDAHPQAFFVSRDFRFDGDRLLGLRGELTLRGASQSVWLQALRFGCTREPPDGTERCGGDFEASLLRSDYGMTFGLPFIADRVRLLVQVMGRRR